MRRPSVFAAIRDLMGFKNNEEMAFIANFDLSTIAHGCSEKTSDKFETAKRILLLCKNLDITAGLYTKEPPGGRAMETGDGYWVVLYDYPDHFEGLANFINEQRFK